MKKLFLENVREIVVDACLNNQRVNESFLAKRLGVSRTPVREALRHLEEDGLIDRRQGAGIRLRRVSLREAIEIFDIRILLEGLACRYLANKMTPQTAGGLEKLEQEFSRAVKSANLDAVKRKDIQLHNFIIKECGNQRLKRIINNLHLITSSFEMSVGLEMARNLPPAQVQPKVAYPHKLLVKTIASGNAAKAEELMRLHIEEGKNTMMSRLLGPGIK